MIEIINPRVEKNTRKQCIHCSSFDVKYTHWMSEASECMVLLMDCGKCGKNIDRQTVSYYDMVTKMDRWRNFNV